MPLAVAALADAEQSCLPAGRVLSRHKPQPGCELTTLVEGSAVADSGHDRGCDQRADTGDLSEPLAGWVGRGDLFDLRVHRNDLLFEILPLAPEKADGCACVASGSSQRP